MTLMEDRYICLVRASADVVALDGTDTVDGMLACSSAYLLLRYNHILYADRVYVHLTRTCMSTRAERSAA